MESQKLYPAVRKFSQEKVSLLFVKDHERNTLILQWQTKVRFQK